MRVESDRDKYSIQRIIAFYQAQPTRLCRIISRPPGAIAIAPQLGKPKASLASTAADMKLSAKYLPLVWGILHDKDAIGPVAKLQAMWNALPAPNQPADAGQLTVETQAMREFRHPHPRPHRHAVLLARS